MFATDSMYEKEHPNGLDDSLGSVRLLELKRLKVKQGLHEFRSRAPRSTTTPREVGRTVLNKRRKAKIPLRQHRVFHPGQAPENQAIQVMVCMHDNEKNRQQTLRLAKRPPCTYNKYWFWTQQYLS